MRKPLHSTHANAQTIRQYFQVRFEESNGVTIITYGGRKITGRPRLHSATLGFYDFCVVDTQAGKEVIYEGDIRKVKPIGYKAVGGSDRIGGAAPIGDDDETTKRLNDALLKGKKVRLHFERSTYKPSGEVVEHLKSEEGGWFCVALGGVHENQPDYVGYYYTPTIEWVEIL